MIQSISGASSETKKDSAGVTAACPQCKASRSTVVARFLPRKVREPWRIVACAGCGLMYTNPRPATEDLADWYDEDYEPHQPREKRPQWHTGLRRAFERFLPAPLRHRALKSPWGERTLLDLGCGSGRYLRKMRDLGWNALGIEPNARAASAAREAAGVEVMEGTLPGIVLPAGSIQLATAWQVLEHVESPRETLAELRRLLTPGGRLALSVPNQGGAAANVYGPDWLGLDLPRHLTHFDSHSLRAMLESEGFRVLKLCTWSQSGWLRHSTGRIPQQRRLGAQRIGESRFLSRLASAWWAHRGRGESLYAEATPAA